MSFLDTLRILLAEVMVYVLIGGLLAWLGLLSAAAVRFVLKNFVVRLLLPLLILEKGLRHLRLEDAGDIATMAGGAVAIVFVQNLVSRAVLAAGLVPAGGRVKRSFVLANSFHNYGFYVYPIVGSLWGPRALSLALIFGLTCDALFWSLGVATIEARGSVHWKELLNPPLVAMVVAIAGAFSGLWGRLPSEAFAAAASVSRFTIPLALTVIGAIIWHAITRVRPAELSLRPLAVSLCLRLVVFPLLFASAALALLGPGVPRSVVLVEAIMPASVGVVMLAVLYDGDHAFVSVYSVVSNVLAVLSIPVWLALLF